MSAHPGPEPILAPGLCGLFLFDIVSVLGANFQVVKVQGMSVNELSSGFHSLMTKIWHLVVL